MHAGKLGTAPRGKKAIKKTMRTNQKRAQLQTTIDIPRQYRSTNYNYRWTKPPNYRLQTIPYPGGLSVQRVKEVVGQRRGHHRLQVQIGETVGRESPSQHAQALIDAVALAAHLQ